MFNKCKPQVGNNVSLVKGSYKRKQLQKFIFHTLKTVILKLFFSIKALKSRASHFHLSVK